MSASSFLLPVCDPVATDPDRVGPKAANLAALAQAGLPTPGGFCITADAYRWQIAHLGLLDTLRDYADADAPLQRRLSVQVRLGLLWATSRRTFWRKSPRPAAINKSLSRCAPRR